MSAEHEARPPMDTARAEATASLATDLRATVVRHVQAHGPHDPMTSDIVASAIMLLIAELSVRVDPTIGPVISTMLVRAYLAPAADEAAP